VVKSRNNRKQLKIKATVLVHNESKYCLHFSTQSLASRLLDSRLLFSLFLFLIPEVTMHNQLNSKLLSTIAPDFESSTEDPDALLARELNRLSMQEREQVLYDVHGVAEVMPEGSEFLSTRLTQLELELAKITEKTEYDQALMQDPNFVKNRNFRIRFLRAERFVAAEAAVRIVRHFQYKMELFGAGKLAKDIEIEDLDNEDIKVLESGSIQLLSVRDRAGRAIMCWNPILRNDAGIEQKVCGLTMTCISSLWLT
jgi:hypothetical protein